MKEYEEMAIRVGDKAGIEINKVDSSGFKDHLIMLPYFSFCACITVFF
jgi:hypothetical protein